MTGEKAAMIAALLTAMTTKTSSSRETDYDDDGWHVGGSDPTANAAIGNVMREGRRSTR